MFNRIVKILSASIMVLSMGGGIVGGVWLAILGEWWLLGIGILLVFTSHFILSILILPSIPIGGIAEHFYERKNPLGHLFGFISQFYTNILMVGTCVLAFFICSRFYTGDVGFGYIPFLLWSWEMALGPWQFLASQEPDNEFSFISLFSASVFYFFFLMSIFISQFLELIIIALFCAIQLIVLPIFNLYTANKMMRNYY